MKHLKKPTREQKKIMVKWRLNPSDWMVERDTTTEMIVVHRHFDKTRRTIHKEERYDA